MNIEDLREKLAAVLDKVHDKYVTEGGCDFQGWRSGHGSRPYVSDAVEELIALGVTLSEDDWEYGTAHADEPDNGIAEVSKEAAEERVARYKRPVLSRDGLVVRRRKAGAWEVMS